MLPLLVRTQNHELIVKDCGFKGWRLGCGVWGVGWGVWGVGFKVALLDASLRGGALFFWCGIQGLGLRVWGVGFWVRCLGVEVLELRVQG